MIFKSNFKMANFLRLLVVVALSLILGVIGALQIQPSVVSAQSQVEISKVCDASVLGVFGANSATPDAVPACEAGYKGSFSGATMANACKPYAGKPGNRFCEIGFKQQQKQSDAGVALSDAQLNTKAEEACKTGSDAQKSACRNGFREGYKGDKTRAEACGNSRPTPYGTAAERTACEQNYDKGQQLKENRPGVADTTDADVDCTRSNFSPLSWIICPIIDLGTGLTDFIFKDFVRPMLENVPISADPNDAGYKAWQGFRLLGNLLLVGTLLAIVYGQMRGGGGR